MISRRSDFKVGALVKAEYGVGRIQSMKPNSAMVKFDDGVLKEIQIMKLTYLDEKKLEISEKKKSIDEENIATSFLKEEELIEDEEIDSSFNVVPSNYSKQTCYSTNAKRFLTYLRKNYDTEGMASVKSYFNKKNEVDTFINGEIGLIIMPNKGIVLFKIADNEWDVEKLKDPFVCKVLNKDAESTKNYYLGKLMSSLNLITIENGEKYLKYPFKYITVFQGINLDDLSDYEKNQIKIIDRNVYFKDLTTLFSNNDVFDNFDNDGEEIPHDQFGVILEKVIGENTTVTDIKPLVINNPMTKNAVKAKFNPIVGNEREISALCLDDEQIRIINDTKPGHYLTLANPGTGKSVILLSKAYRIQSKEDNIKVLITCYNNNLKDHHEEFAADKGFNTGNITICTFHKLALEALNEFDPEFYYGNHLDSIRDEDDDVWVKIVDRFSTLVENGEVKHTYKAIFIDEVQLFAPKWIDICYQLLDSKNNDDVYFEMFGDINQDVRAQRSRGLASWQNTDCLPSLKGRVKKLTKNYRNTSIIAKYLNAYMNEFNSTLKEHNMPVDEEATCLTSECVRKGKQKVKIISMNNKQTKVTADTIVAIIKELVNKRKIDYRKIAIVYPASRCAGYYPVYYLENALNTNNIKYNHINGDNKTKIFECDGVILSTIDSCLGLDYDFVILMGVHFWDLIPGTWEKVDENNIFGKQQFKFHYNEVGKKIYAACSRARDGLYIIDDFNTGSPFEDIIRPKCGEDYFDD